MVAILLAGALWFGVTVLMINREGTASEWLPLAAAACGFILPLPLLAGKGGPSIGRQFARFVAILACLPLGFAPLGFAMWVSKVMGVAPEQWPMALSVGAPCVSIVLSIVLSRWVGARFVVRNVSSQC